MDKNKKILIVDDEPDVLNVLEKRLTGSGYQVVKAAEGQRALRLAKSEKPDLIVLDINLPEMDGGEVAARLREEEETRNIPVIFLSCLVTEKDQNKAAMGDSLFLAKPYDPHVLLSGIEKML